MTAYDRIRDRIRHTFASWSRLIVEDRGVNPPATAELHATAVFLTIHADWLACQPLAYSANSRYQAAEPSASNTSRLPNSR